MNEKLSDQFEQMFMQGHPEKWVIPAVVLHEGYKGTMGGEITLTRAVHGVIPGFHKRLKGLESGMQDVFSALRAAREKHKKARKQVSYLAGQVRELKEKLKNPTYTEPELIAWLHSRIADLAREGKDAHTQAAHSDQLLFQERLKSAELRNTCAESEREIKDLKRKLNACKIDGFDNFTAFEEHARKATAINLGGIAWARMDQLNLTAAHRDKLLAEQSKGMADLTSDLARVTKDYELYRRTMQLEREELIKRIQPFQQEYEVRIKELREQIRALLKQRSALLKIVGESEEEDEETEEPTPTCSTCQDKGGTTNLTTGRPIPRKCIGCGKKCTDCDGTAFTEVGGVSSMCEHCFAGVR